MKSKNIVILAAALSTALHGCVNQKESDNAATAGICQNGYTISSGSLNAKVISAGKNKGNAYITLDGFAFLHNLLPIANLKSISHINTSASRPERRPCGIRTTINRDYLDASSKTVLKLNEIIELERDNRARAEFNFSKREKGYSVIGFRFQIPDYDFFNDDLTLIKPNGKMRIRLSEIPSKRPDMIQEEITGMEINTISSKAALLHMEPPMRLFIRRISNKKNPDIKSVAFVFTLREKNIKEEKFKLELKISENKDNNK